MPVSSAAPLAEVGSGRPESILPTSPATVAALHPARHPGVDAWRLYAIVAVIAIHTETFQNVTPDTRDLWDFAGVLINQLARFAVPFFFSISGYFWARKLAHAGQVASPTRAMAGRIVLLFVAWSAIYLLANPVALQDGGLANLLAAEQRKLQRMLDAPVGFLLAGTKVHLWYLSSLLMAMTLSALLVAAGQTRLLVAVAVVLYVLGVLAKAYANAPIGLHWTFDTRHGPFFATLPFVAGYLLAQRPVSARWSTFGWGLLLAGTGLHLTEIIALSAGFGSTVYQDYVFGTVIAGVGAAMVALSSRPGLGSVTTLSSRLGPYTLGVYAVHLLFVEMLEPTVRRLDSRVAELLFIVAVLALSSLVVVAMGRWRVTRALVT